MLRLTTVVKNLLIINVIMFLVRFILPNHLDLLALHYPKSDLFLPVQLVTHFFMHGGFAHIFFNMFALVMFGSALENLLGPKKFLYLYFFSALGAALLHMGYSYYEFSGLESLRDSFTALPSFESFWAFFDKVPEGMYKKEALDQVSDLIRQGNIAAINEAAEAMDSFIGIKMNIPIVGASGAIYGLLLAFGMFFPNAELMLIFFPVPVKAKYFIPVLMLIELFLGVNQFSWDNIAHFAHLGGAISGFLLILYWRKFGSRFN